MMEKKQEENKFLYVYCTKRKNPNNMYDGKNGIEIKGESAHCTLHTAKCIKRTKTASNKRKEKKMATKL